MPNMDENNHTEWTLYTPGAYRVHSVILAIAMPALLLLTGCEKSEAGPEISRIAFGSCAHQDKSQPIWEPIVATEPDLFVFTGDNIYGDTEDMEVMRAKYQKLGAKPGFLKLRASCPILAVWDDHDYGLNDAGKEYSKKVESGGRVSRIFRNLGIRPS